MHPIELTHVRSLVRFIVEQVVGRFFSTLRQYSEDKTVSYHVELHWFSNRITDEIWRSWNDVNSADHAEHKLEEMYNAARTELINLLNLQGGTVEFGPGDVQPLTDQRLGQSEAWDLWVAHMWETHFQAGWYFNGEHYADDLDDFFAVWDAIPYVSKHDATIEYHRVDTHQSWTYTSFNHDRFNDLLGTRL